MHPANISVRSCVVIAGVLVFGYMLIMSNLQKWEHSKMGAFIRTDEKNLISDTNEVVFLIRTYAGHFDESKFFKLTTMLQSLIALKNGNWTAYLLNTDKKPLPVRGHAVESMMISDHRIRLLHVPVRQTYNLWTAGYDVTDAALEKLKHTNFEWIVITNGDNVYEPSFLSHLNDGERTDIVLVNYWSRWNRVDSVDISQHSSTVCHAGRLQPGFVDVGGAIISLTRFQREGHRFMKFGPVNGQDGLTFTKLSFLKWTVKIIPECLFSHSPNPYACNRLGGVWYNSPLSLNDLSDGCWTPERAKLKAAVGDPRPSVTVSSSGLNILALSGGDHSSNLDLMRKEQVEFAGEYNARMRKIRGALCKALRSSNWQLDVASYGRLNPDLVTVGLDETQMRDHFWNSGCYEMRPIANANPKYYMIEN